MTNPLLAPWTAPFGLPPFADIRDDDFGPAFDQGLAEARAAIAAIADSSDAPTYANTIAALQLALQGVVAAGLVTFSSQHGGQARGQLQQRWAPVQAPQ